MSPQNAFHIPHYPCQASKAFQNPVCEEKTLARDGLVPLLSSDMFDLHKDPLELTGIYKNGYIIELWKCGQLWITQRKCKHCIIYLN